MAKIIFEFPGDGPQDFYSAEGYVQMQVENGRLELEHEPNEALLNLIKKFEGKRVEEPEPEKASLKKAKKGEDSQ